MLYKCNLIEVTSYPSIEYGILRSGTTNRPTHPPTHRQQKIWFRLKRRRDIWQHTININIKRWGRINPTPLLKNVSCLISQFSSMRAQKSQIAKLVIRYVWENVSVKDLCCVMLLDFSYWKLSLLYKLWLARLRWPNTRHNTIPSVLQQIEEDDVTDTDVKHLTWIIQTHLVVLIDHFHQFKPTWRYDILSDKGCVQNPFEFESWVIAGAGTTSCWRNRAVTAEQLSLAERRQDCIILSSYWITKA